MLRCDSCVRWWSCSNVFFDTGICLCVHSQLQATQASLLARKAHLQAMILELEQQESRVEALLGTLPATPSC